MAGALGLGALLRAHLALHDDGIYWPDEIFQSLEPAHRLVFGYGLVAWEFVEGARSWAFPGLCAFLLKLLSLLGLDAPRAYLGAVRLFFAAVGVATAWATYKLSRSGGARFPQAAAAAAVFALAAPCIYFAPRAMSETTSALFVTLGLALAWGPSDKRWERIAGASLLGASVLLRLQNGVFCVALLFVLAGRRRWREVREAAAVLLVWAFLFGLLDRLTWHGWFHSAAVYLKFNLVEGKASQWGTAEFGYYARVLGSSFGAPLAVLTAGLACVGACRAPALFLTAVAFFLLHSFVPHKEFRFLFPALPLFSALAGLGAQGLLSWPRLQRVTLAALLGLALFSAVTSRGLTFGRLGQYEKEKPQASAFDDFGPVNRLLLAAHEERELCGLKVESAHLAWTGGHTYLHRRVPLYPHFGPGPESGLFNYVISFRGRYPSARVAAAEGDLVLLQLAPSCLADPQYQWRLP